MYVASVDPSTDAAAWIAVTNKGRPGGVADEAEEIVVEYRGSG